MEKRRPSRSQRTKSVSPDPAGKISEPTLSRLQNSGIVETHARTQQARFIVLLRRDRLYPTTWKFVFYWADKARLDSSVSELVSLCR